MRTKEGEEEEEEEGEAQGSKKTFFEPY